MTSVKNVSVGRVQKRRSCGNKIEETTKPSVAVIMFSHRWLRPDADQAHPDDAAGHKAMAMVQFADWLMWMQSASSQMYWADTFLASESK